MERFAPLLFVLLWSSGFVVAHYGTEDSGPFTFLAVRFVIAAALLWVIAAVIKAPAITRQQTMWASTSAMGMQVLYLGGVFFAIANGLPSGLSALISGLHPVITSIGARRFLGERMRRIQWIGIGVGVAGVVAVVIDRLHAGAHGVTATALVAMMVSVFGMAGGTLVQRSRGAAMPLVRGTAVQYTASAMVLLGAAIFNEHWKLHITARVLFSLGWAVLVLSLAAVLIMMMLLQRQAAAKVSSLFFLTPALSAIEGAILLHEHLAALTVVGLVVSLAGVAMTTRQVR